jgi:hypothetical protein
LNLARAVNVALTVRPRHASIVTWPGSGITDILQLEGGAFAYEAGELNSDRIANIDLDSS